MVGLFSYYRGVIIICILGMTYIISPVEKVQMTQADKLRWTRQFWACMTNLPTMTAHNNPFTQEWSASMSIFLEGQWRLSLSESKLRTYNYLHEPNYWAPLYQPKQLLSIYSIPHSQNSVTNTKHLACLADMLSFLNHWLCANILIALPEATGIKNIKWP